MNQKLQQKAQLIADKLKQEYPKVDTPLIHKNLYELLIATILSPQTTDPVTNKVTKVLFKHYPSFEILANAEATNVEKIIHSVNYHRTKSKNIIAASKMILDEFHGIVPNSLGDLIKLPGVGRKVGNVIISEWFAKPLERRGSPNLTAEQLVQLKDWEKVKVEPEGFVIDTHVLRVSKRLGLTKNTDPKKVEQDLMQLFNKEDWPEMSLRLIFHGRSMCKAKDNQCCNDEFWSGMCEC